MAALKAWFERALAPYRLVARPLPRRRPGVTHADGRFTPSGPAPPAPPTLAEQQRLRAAHADLREKWVAGTITLWGRPTTTAGLSEIDAGETDKRRARFFPLSNRLRFLSDPPDAWHHDVQVEDASPTELAKPKPRTMGVRHAQLMRRCNLVEKVWIAAGKPPWKSDEAFYAAKLKYPNEAVLNVGERAQRMCWRIVHCASS